MLDPLHTNKPHYYLKHKPSRVSSDFEEGFMSYPKTISMQNCTTGASSYRDRREVSSEIHWRHGVIWDFIVFSSRKFPDLRQI